MIWCQVPEHTWGADVKKAMPDYRNWSNADFRTALSAGVYDDVIHSWRRQRAYLDWGLEALSEALAVDASVAATVVSCHMHAALLQELSQCSSEARSDILLDHQFR